MASTVKTCSDWEINQLMTTYLLATGWKLVGIYMPVQHPKTGEPALAFFDMCIGDGHYTLSTHGVHSLEGSRCKRDKQNCNHLEPNASEVPVEMLSGTDPAALEPLLKAFYAKWCAVTEEFDSSCEDSDDDEEENDKDADAGDDGGDDDFEEDYLTSSSESDMDY
jgi:hypothetical protein